MRPGELLVFWTEQRIAFILACMVFFQLRQKFQVCGEKGISFVYVPLTKIESYFSKKKKKKMAFIHLEN